MALNVNRNVQDAFYRYKMPRLQAKVEGKGNGVKTVIPNMVDIAKALGRPPTYCTKYFGCELGAQTQFDFKNERYIVNGSHDAEKLQDMLDGFIKKFVLCEQCDNPETVIKVNNKKQIITASCKACGHTFMLDMRHKLTTFIIKNPPEQNISAQGTSLTKRKDRKKNKGAGGNDENENEENNENGSFITAVPEERNGDDAGGADKDEWGDDEWSADVSEEAVKERMKSLTGGIQGLTMDNDIEKTETERINLFHDFVKAKLAADASLGDNADKAIKAEAERLEVVNKAPIVLCELLFSGEGVVATLKKQRRLFIRFCHENQKAQKYLLGGFEKTVEAHEAQLLPKTAVILKNLYELDIVEEEVLLEWGKKVSKKYVSKELSEKIHKKAEPLITWLKEAEEESSDEDDDDIELEFDERAKISSIKEEIKTDDAAKDKDKAEESGKNGKKEDEEEDEDLDIDDI